MALCEYTLRVRAVSGFCRIPPWLHSYSLSRSSLFIPVISPLLSNVSVCLSSSAFLHRGSCFQFSVLLTPLLTAVLFQLTIAHAELRHFGNLQLLSDSCDQERFFFLWLNKLPMQWGITRPLHLLNGLSYENIPYVTSQKWTLQNTIETEPVRPCWDELPAGKHVIIFYISVLSLPYSIPLWSFVFCYFSTHQMGHIIWAWQIPCCLLPPFYLLFIFNDRSAVCSAL